MPTVVDSADLLRHVTADKAPLYRGVMDVFAAAKRQYRLQLRPDEVLSEANWPNSVPRIEEINAILAQLAQWGNLESQPDTARVSSLSDFYRARFLYRLSHGGEAVEAGLTVLLHRTGEVLMRLRAASLNPHDDFVVRGIISTADGRVPLTDGAGEVLACGEGVTDLRVGDAVVSTFWPYWNGGDMTASTRREISGELALECPCECPTNMFGW